MELMEKQEITIPMKKYQELQQYKKVDQELLSDIAEGIKDILNGNIEEI